FQSNLWPAGKPSTPDIAEPNNFFAGRCGHARHAGALQTSAPFRLILPQRRHSAGKFKSHTLAMHLSARAYALHNLLANVTALVEVERICLPRLLGQVAVADVLAIIWNAVQHAPHLQRLGAHRLRSCGGQLAPEVVCMCGIDPDFEPV